MKQEITHEEYVMLCGIRAIAETHNAALDSARAAAQRILGEAEEWGHASDMVYDDCGSDVAAFLRQRNVRVGPIEEEG